MDEFALASGGNVDAGRYQSECCLADVDLHDKKPLPACPECFEACKWRLTDDYRPSGVLTNPPLHKSERPTARPSRMRKRKGSVPKMFAAVDRVRTTLRRLVGED